MNPEVKQLLRTNRVLLVEEMNPDALKNHLLEKELLTERECEQVGSKDSLQAKNEHILGALKTKGPKAKLFLDILAQIQPDLAQGIHSPNTTHTDTTAGGLKQNTVKFLQNEIPLRGDREKLAISLAEEVNEQKNRICWLRGSPGCGKSALAKSVLHNLAKMKRLNDSSMVHINSRNDETVPAIVKKILAKLHQFRTATPDASKAEEQTLWPVLQSLPPKLFLLDNCDRLISKNEQKFLDFLTEFIEKDIITVMITTCFFPRGDFGLTLYEIKVNMLNNEEAMDLLAWLYAGRKEKFNPDSQENTRCRRQLSHLSRLFCGMPRPIIDIGNEMRESPQTLSKMYRRYQRIKFNKGLIEGYYHLTPQGRNLKSYFDNHLKTLCDDKLLLFLRRLAVIPYRFTRSLGSKVLGYDDSTHSAYLKQIVRLIDSNLLRENDLDFLAIPELLRQHLMLLNEENPSIQSAHQEDKKRYSRFIIDHVRSVIWQYNDEPAKAVATFVRRKPWIVKLLSSCKNLAEGDLETWREFSEFVTERSCPVINEMLPQSVLLKFYKVSVTLARNSTWKAAFLVAQTEVLLKFYSSKKNRTELELLIAQASVVERKADKCPPWLLGRYRNAKANVKVAFKRGTEALDIMKEVAFPVTTKYAERLSFDGFMLMARACCLQNDFLSGTGYYGAAVIAAEMSETEKPGIRFSIYNRRFTAKIRKGECLFKCKNFSGASALFKELLPENKLCADLRSVVGPESFDAHKVCLAAIFYAKALSQLGERFLAWPYFSGDVLSSLTSLQFALLSIVSVSTDCAKVYCNLQAMINLAIGKVAFIQSLFSVAEGRQDDAKFGLAEKALSDVNEVCTKSSVRREMQKEASSFLILLHAYKTKIESTDDNRFSDENRLPGASGLAEVFIKADGSLVDPTVFKFETSSNEAETFVKLFGSSFFYSDLVKGLSNDQNEESDEEVDCNTDDEFGLSFSSESHEDSDSDKDEREKFGLRRSPKLGYPRMSTYFFDVFEPVLTRRKETLRNTSFCEGTVFGNSSSIALMTTTRSNASKPEECHHDQNPFKAENPSNGELLSSDS
eukprot:m.63683 g.63683  ORF g.63683 m.63683 type:complete len:1070 (+) comp35182_c1_seq1:56-3265(+)